MIIYFVFSFLFGFYPEWILFNCICIFFACVPHRKSWLKSILEFNVGSAELRMANATLCWEKGHFQLGLVSLAFSISAYEKLYKSIRKAAHWKISSQKIGQFSRHKRGKASTNDTVFEFSSLEEKLGSIFGLVLRAEKWCWAGLRQWLWAGFFSKIVL